MQIDKEGFLCTTEGYKLHDIDDSADPKYYGFVSNNHNWYIMKESVSAKSFRYAKGGLGYATAWSGRAALSYNYWDEI